MRLRFTSGCMAVLFVVLAAAASGCASSSNDVYQKQIAQADAAYKAGKISTTEYLKLKEDAKNAYLASPQNN
jgi:outer membrane lipoprotein SlyB